MAPHVIDIEIIQLPIPSYGIKSLLGADDGSMLWPIPDFEHALTRIADNRSHLQQTLFSHTIESKPVPMVLSPSLSPSI